MPLLQNNVALDGTGDGSVKSLTKKIDDARKAGMRIEGIYATIDIDTAIARSMQRGEKTGRYVAEERIISIHKKVSQILPEVAPKFDSVSVFYTGEEVTLIATGGSGEGLSAIAGEEKLFEQFLKKAK